MFLKIGFRFRVIGRENIPRKGGVVLAANHASYLDPPALGSASPRMVYFMARDTLFKNRLLSFWMRNVGVIPLKRHSAHLSALREALELVKKGRVLGLFPEGTRNITGKTEKANAGVAFLAAQAGVPVVPAYISGTDTALPKNARSVRFHKIVVRFGKPLHIEKGADYQDSARQIMERIYQLKNAG